MNANINPVFIFSVARTEKTESQNNTAHEMVHRALVLNGFSFVSGVGVTKDWGKERCFVVVLPSESNPTYQVKRDFLESVAAAYKQDAVLYLDTERNAYLISSSKTERLGKMTPVSKEEALESGNYTQIGEDRFYSIK